MLRHEAFPLPALAPPATSQRRPGLAHARSAKWHTVHRLLHLQNAVTEESSLRRRLLHLRWPFCPLRLGRPAEDSSAMRNCPLAGPSSLLVLRGSNLFPWAILPVSLDVALRSDAALGRMEARS